VIRFLFRLVRLVMVLALGAALAAKFLLRSHASEETDEIDLVNIFGTQRLISSADPFFGGKVTSAFAGTTLDLRRVVPAPTGVYLDILVAFGAVSLVVPPGWRVVFDGNVVGGAFEDLTQTTSDPDAPIVRIGGLVALGALQAATRPSIDPVA
jgi:hypothetical protein